MGRRGTWMGIVGALVLLSAAEARAQQADPSTAQNPTTDATVAPAQAPAPDATAGVSTAPWTPPLTNSLALAGNGEQASAVSAPPTTEGDDYQGIFGPVGIGVIGSAGFPRPLGVEGFLYIDKLVGLGVEYSTLPSTSLAGVQTQLSAVSAGIKVFPFRSSFFVGISGGHQRLSASDSVSLPAGVGSGALQAQITGDTYFINPKIGFLATWDWGLALGIDAGVQIPVTSTFSSNVPSIVPVASDVNDMAHFFTKNTLPSIDLLRIGLLL